MPERNNSCHEILLTIRKIIRSLDTHSKKLQTIAGVTGPQLIILKEISHNKNVTTTELAGLVSLSQSTVTSIVDRLVEHDYVSRVRDKVDRRRWFLELSVSGKALIASQPPLVQDHFVQNFSSLPKWEQTEILSTLQRVADMMHKEQA